MSVYGKENHEMLTYGHFMVFAWINSLQQSYLHKIYISSISQNSNIGRTAAPKAPLLLVELLEIDCQLPISNWSVALANVTVGRLLMP